MELIFAFTECTCRSTGRTPCLLTEGECQIDSFKSVSVCFNDSMTKSSFSHECSVQEDTFLIIRKILHYVVIKEFKAKCDFMDRLNCLSSLFYSM